MVIAGEHIYHNYDIIGRYHILIQLSRKFYLYKLMLEFIGQLEQSELISLFHMIYRIQNTLVI